MENEASTVDAPQYDEANVFHQFSEFPKEIQLEIFRIAITDSPPRLVEINAGCMCATDVPALLSVNTTSRSVALKFYNNIRGTIPLSRTDRLRPIYFDIERDTLILAACLNFGPTPVELGIPVIVSQRANAVRNELQDRSSFGRNFTQYLNLSARRIKHVALDVTRQQLTHHAVKGGRRRFMNNPREKMMSTASIVELVHAIRYVTSNFWLKDLTPIGIESQLDGVFSRLVQSVTRLPIYPPIAVVVNHLPAMRPYEKDTEFRSRFDPRSAWLPLKSNTTVKPPIVNIAKRNKEIELDEEVHKRFCLFCEERQMAVPSRLVNFAKMKKELGKNRELLMLFCSFSEEMERRCE